jgi:hypothetical protein
MLPDLAGHLYSLILSLKKMRALFYEADNRNRIETLKTDKKFVAELRLVSCRMIMILVEVEER